MLTTICTPTLTVSGCVATGMISFAITFDGYTGAVEPLVVDTNELTAASGTVTAEVATRQEGTETLRGDFTLSFQGQGTPALSINATDVEVSRPVSVAFPLS